MEILLTEQKALRIRSLRCGIPVHSWRRISEIICEEFPDEDQDLKGNQLHGSDLCRDAMALLHGNGDFAKVSNQIRNKWDT